MYRDLFGLIRCIRGGHQLDALRHIFRHFLHDPRHEIGHLALRDLHSPHHHLGLFRAPFLPNRTAKKVQQSGQFFSSEELGIYRHVLAADVFVAHLRENQVQKAGARSRLYPQRAPFGPSRPLAPRWSMPSAAPSASLPAIAPPVRDAASCHRLRPQRMKHEEGQWYRRRWIVRRR